jgi:hypothetical protein
MREDQGPRGGRNGYFGMKWLMSVARIIGASFPYCSSLLQLQAEIDSAAVQRRLLVLEDPISQLHPGIREVSEKLYNELSAKGEATLRFDPGFYSQHGKSLAILEAQGFIVGSHAIGARYVDGLWLQDPRYIVYLCSLYEDQGRMDRLVELLEACPPGQWLRGEEIANALQLPRPVVKALFDLYEQRGLGVCSKEIGAILYLSRA